MTGIKHVRFQACPGSSKLVVKSCLISSVVLHQVLSVTERCTVPSNPKRCLVARKTVSVRFPPPTHFQNDALPNSEPFRYYELSGSARSPEHLALTDAWRRPGSRQERQTDRHTARLMGSEMAARIASRLIGLVARLTDTDPIPLHATNYTR